MNGGRDRARYGALLRPPHDRDNARERITTRWKGIDDRGTRRDELDNIVEICTVVDAGDPTRIGDTGMGKRRQQLQRAEQQGH